jgi:pimeloyl-ACP methyl ester carboxylesterase
MAEGSPRNARPTAPWHAKRADEEYGRRDEPDWRTIDWQSHLHQVEIERRRVNYVDIGSGDITPVVLVHGLGGQWQNWLENIPRLAQDRRVIALDLPGFGLSEMPWEAISIPGYGRTVEALCERVGVERAHLVGNSMGGFVASEVAIQFPQLVERLVLVSAAGVSSANASRAPVLTIGRAAAAIASYTAAGHRRLAGRRVTRHGALAFVARHPSKLAPDLVWEGFMKGAGKPGFNDALRACLEYDFRDRLSEISVPTLIVWGESDTVIPVRDAQEFERLIEDARKVVMEDTGHVPMAERPRTFNGLLLDFLSETGPAEEHEPAEAESQEV